MRHSRFLAVTRLSAFLLVIGGLLPCYLIAYPFGRRARRAFSYPFYRGCVLLTGLSLRTTGRRSTEAGTLFVANHASYLDIPVLATLVDGMFVAKAEVRTWPLFGFLARIGRTVFVARRASKVPRERLAIANHLAAGESIFLFPEGSSSDGAGILPFRTGLLSAALVDEDLTVTVQPISIVYGPAAEDRPALPQEDRDRFAWYGDMDLAPHLWHVFGLNRRTVVSVHFHPPRQSTDFPNRRTLAAWGEEAVSDGVSRALIGASPDTVVPFSSKSQKRAASVG